MRFIYKRKIQERKKKTYTIMKFGYSITIPFRWDLMERVVLAMRLLPLISVKIA